MKKGSKLLYFPTFEAWFWAKVDYDTQDIERCWSWLGGKSPNGYGVCRAPSTLTGVQPRFSFQPHRMAYELTFDEWPEGAEPDHTCHDSELCRLGNDCPHRKCCNPYHIQPSSHQDNCGRIQDKTHCSRGHVLADVGVYLQLNKNGKRYASCKECSRLYKSSRKVGEHN